MINRFYGFKLNQSQIFNDQNERLTITRVLVKPLKVIGIKTPKKDGYPAFQVSFNHPKHKKKIVKEIKFTDEANVKIGDLISIEQFFKVGDRVKLRGLIKGRGFAGVVKRWGFAGGPKTHGQSDRERAPGSIGMRTTPGRVWKGKKMAGHMGANWKTIKGLKIVDINKEKNLLTIGGLVPGYSGGLLKISKG